MNRRFKTISHLSLLTLISKLLGFARDMVWALLFGASGQLDAFLIAFRLPNLTRRIFVEGALTQALLPVLVEYNNQASESTTPEAVNNIAGALLLVLGGTCLLAVMFAPLLVLLLAPGYLNAPSNWTLTTHMLRITLPYIGLIGATAFFSALLNYHRHFLTPALAPILLNLSLIGGTYWLSQFLTTPIYGLAWALFIGGIMQLILVLTMTRCFQSVPRPQFNINHPSVRHLLKRLLPIVFGASITQINLLLDIIFASFLSSGHIAWLYYSERLLYLPEGLIGVTLATVIMPELASSHSQNDRYRFNDTLAWSIYHCLLIGIPAALGMALLAGPLIITLFVSSYSAFTLHDAMMTQYSLGGYALGLPALMLIRVLTTSYYAQKTVKIPMISGLIGIAVNLILNAFLIYPLTHVGLAFSTSLATWVYVIGLCYGLRRRLKSLKWKHFGLQLLTANSIMVAWVFGITPRLPQWAAWTFIEQVIVLSTIILSAIGVYALGLWIIRYRLHDFRGKQWS